MIIKWGFLSHVAGKCTPGRLKFWKISGGACPQTPLEVRDFSFSEYLPTHKPVPFYFKLKLMKTVCILHIVAWQFTILIEWDRTSACEGAFVQKGRLSVFGQFSFFFRIELIFHRQTCFDMKRIVPQLSRWICASFSRNNVCKKLSFPLETFCSTKNKRNLLFHLVLLFV